ncbi:hypothetical protein Misp01_82810 [Microtetraspora sp. NBRC 13810]|nr:hypothetical protein Misp01_82810 [Microtetraspora sp. NBRC 13810]
MARPVQAAPVPGGPRLPLREEDGIRGHARSLVPGESGLAGGGTSARRDGLAGGGTGAGT